MLVAEADDAERQCAAERYYWKTDLFIASEEVEHGWVDETAYHCSCGGETNGDGPVLVEVLR